MAVMKTKRVSQTAAPKVSTEHVARGVSGKTLTERQFEQLLKSLARLDADQIGRATDYNRNGNVATSAEMNTR
jgi:hypothetical protein